MPITALQTSAIKRHVVGHARASFTHYLHGQCGTSLYPLRSLRDELSEAELARPCRGQLLGGAARKSGENVDTNEGSPPLYPAPLPPLFSALHRSANPLAVSAQRVPTSTAPTPKAACDGSGTLNPSTRARGLRSGRRWRSWCDGASDDAASPQPQPQHRHHRVTKVKP